MIRLIVTVIVLFSAATLPALTNEQLRERMLQELEIIQNSFQVRYAPAAWKKEYVGWDLDEQVQWAKNEIAQLSVAKIKDYQRILRKFFKSAKDYHVDVFFYSTEIAFLPFRVQSANNRYFLAWVDPKNAPPTWKVGDEILMFNGTTIQEAVAQLKATEMGNPESLTDQALAEIYLTARVGSVGHLVPQGDISIVIQHKNGNQAAYSLKWLYHSEEVSEGPYKAMAAMSFKEEKKRSLDQIALMHRQMIASVYEDIHGSFEKQYGYEISSLELSGAELLGERKGFLPPLGEIIWEAPGSNSYFRAYLFKAANNKVIGYLRIPQYAGGAAAAQEFAKLVKTFEAHSDGLIIDQMNNPGGDVFLMYAMASMLSPSPLIVLPHKVSITQGDVYTALEALNNFPKDLFNENEADVEDIYSNAEQPSGQGNGENTLSGYPITADMIENMRDYFYFIIDQWNQGRFITEPVYLFGIQQLAKPAQVYTKNILVLANQLSLSCGDLFAALMQDNRRGVVMGTQTGGAGGFIVPQSHQSIFGIRGYTLTGSIAERPNGHPLENLGVIPDIEYVVTVNDLQNNYKEFADKIRSVIDQIVPNATVKREKGPSPLKK